MNTPHLIRSMVAASLVTMAAGPSVLLAQELPLEHVSVDRAEADAVVRVTNHNWLDMHVYVIRDGGQRLSIGTVGSLQSAELALPFRALDPGARVQLVADPVGSRGVYVSPEIVASPADDVILTIQNSLALSFLSVQRRAEIEVAPS